MKFKNAIWIVIIFVLTCFIFGTIHYLSSEGYIVECFANGPIQESSKTSHTVDLPLTNTISCQNFCGPTSRCAITGQQCFADIDCSGCQPSLPTEKRVTGCVLGDNDAGKLTVGVTPQYSPLTSGYGTHKAIITDKLYGKPSQANFGVDNWRASFDEGQALFDKRYKPSQHQYQFMPHYPPIYSVTGEFLGDGPLPSNY